MLSLNEKRTRKEREVKWKEASGKKEHPFGDGVFLCERKEEQNEGLDLTRENNSHMHFLNHCPDT